jgi:hypothetical protein
LTWCSLDLENQTLSVIQTLTDLRTVNPDGTGQVRSVANPPKTAASRRTLHLSEQNLAAIERHKLIHSIRRLQVGVSWVETDYVVTSSFGTPVSQANSLKVFKNFVKSNGLRYIRIHDIRHTTNCSFGSGSGCVIGFRRHLVIPELKSRSRYTPHMFRYSTITSSRVFQITWRVSRFKSQNQIFGFAIAGSCYRKYICASSHLQK